MTAVPYTASLMVCFFATTLDSFAKTSMLRPSGVVQNISVGSVLIKLESSMVESRCILLRRWILPITDGVGHINAEAVDSSNIKCAVQYIAREGLWNGVFTVFSLLSAACRKGESCRGTDRLWSFAKSCLFHLREDYITTLTHLSKSRSPINVMIFSSCCSIPISRFKIGSQSGETSRVEPMPMNKDKDRDFTCKKQETRSSEDMRHRALQLPL